MTQARAWLRAVGGVAQNPELGVDPGGGLGKGDVVGQEPSWLGPAASEGLCVSFRTGGLVTVWVGL